MVVMGILEGIRFATDRQSNGDVNIVVEKFHNREASIEIEVFFCLYDMFGFISLNEEY